LDPAAGSHQNGDFGKELAVIFFWNNLQQLWHTSYYLPLYVTWFCEHVHSDIPYDFICSSTL